MKITKVFTLFVFSFLISCGINEPKLPVWDTEWTLDLPTKDFVMTEVVDDSLFYADTTDLGIPIITLSISDSTEWERIESSDLAAEGIEDNFTITVGNVELEEAEELQTDTIFVMDILPPQLAAAGDTIPPYSAFQLNPNDSEEEYSHYQSVHVVKGNIWLTFHNDMFLSIESGMVISLYNNDVAAELIGSIVFNSAIAPGQIVSSDPFSIADKTISNKLRISYSIPIAGTDTITYLSDEDKTGGFNTDVHMDKLIVDRAIAKIPDQEVTYQDSVTMPQDDFRISEAVVDQGTITLRLNSHIALSADLNIILPDVQYNGTPKTIQTTIVPGIETVESINLSGCVLSKADNPGAFLDELGFEVTSVIGSDDQMVEINATDSVSVDIETDSLYFSSFEGEVSDISFEIDPDESEGFEGLQDLEPGIRFTDLEMRLVFENEINFGVDMDLHIVGYRYENDVIADSVHINIVETIDPNSVSPQTVIVLNESSSTPSIVDLIAILPTKLKFYGTGTVGGQGSIEVNQGVRALFTIESPLSIDLANAIVQEMEVDTLDENDIDEDTRKTLTQDIQEAAAELVLNNGLPIGAEVIMYLGRNRAQLDEDQITASDSMLIFQGIVEAGQTGTDGYVNQAVESTVSMELSETDLQIFNYIPLYLKQKVVIAPTNGTVRIRQDDKIGIKARIRVKYTVNPE